MRTAVCSCQILLHPLGLWLTSGLVGVACEVRDIGMKHQELRHVVITVILQELRPWLTLCTAVDLQPL